MPLPVPKKDESKKDFIDRCMADDVMNQEYPDNDQRYAICQTQWKEKQKNSATPFIERRYIPIDSEFRYDTDKNEVEGYASVFGIEYDVFGFKESVSRGAFKKTIKENDIRGLFNHDPSYVLGRNKAGTLELKEDEYGLHYLIKLPNTTYANDLKESISRGDVSQSSFGFQVIKDVWENDFSKRTITEAKLFDVSPVTFPASEKTEVKLRSALIDYGIDYNALNLIIIKANRDMGLTDDDIELLNKTKEILDGFIPKMEPLETHSAIDEPDLSTLGALRDKRSNILKSLAKTGRKYE